MLNWNNIYWRIASRRGKCWPSCQGRPIWMYCVRECYPGICKGSSWKWYVGWLAPVGCWRSGHTRGMPLFRWLPGWRKGESCTRLTWTTSWKISLANILKKVVCRSVSFFTWGMLARLFPRWMKCLIWCLSMPINGNIRNIIAWYLIRFVTGESLSRTTYCGMARWRIREWNRMPKRKVYWTLMKWYRPIAGWRISCCLFVTG